MHEPHHWIFILSRCDVVQGRRARWGDDTLDQPNADLPNSIAVDKGCINLQLGLLPDGPASRRLARLRFAVVLDRS